MNRPIVIGIKTFHTAIFLFMSVAILYILYSGLTRTYDWKLVAAFAAIILEIAVYLLNGLRCPLTKLAQQYGDPTGNDLIADIFPAPLFRSQDSAPLWRPVRHQCHRPPGQTTSSH